MNERGKAVMDSNSYMYTVCMKYVEWFPVSTMITSVSHHDNEQSRKI